ncbi:hypothetical protein [Nocardia vinacea]|uniref:hypothetical protein n=1 Tax=Nocardia vinacea TaxID=96468 RepID=UPI0002E4711D|nr:hypothetical protein [Nocardia vinacea]
MKLWKLLSIVGAVVLLTVTAVAVIIYRASDDDSFAAPAGPALAYAYYTPEELVVLRGDRIVARLPRIFSYSAFAQMNRVVWTSTGDYVALLSLPDPKTPTNADLIAINTRTGEQSSTRCESCKDLVALDGNQIAVLRKGMQSSTANTAFAPVNKVVPEPNTQLLRFDLGTSQPSPVGDPMKFYAQQLELGTRSHFLVRATFLVGETIKGGLTGGEVLASAAGDVGYRVDQPSTSGDVDTAPLGHQRVLLVTNKRTGIGSCAQRGTASLLTMDGHTRPVEPPPVKPSGSASDSDFGVNLGIPWWGLDGNFHVPVTTWRCVAEDKTLATETERQRSQKVSADINTWWTLDPATMEWHHDTAPAATMIRFTGDHSYVSLDTPTCIGKPSIEERTDKHYCDVGTLYLVHNSTKSKVADNVLAILTEPQTRQ